MLTGAEPALSSAIAVIAPRGDEARAVALLAMQNGLVAPNSPARRDNDEHMAALRTWMRDIRRENGLAAAGDEQRVQATRSLVEPTAESLRAAREATVQWIDRALRMKDDGRGLPRAHAARTRSKPSASFSGAETLAALYLRHGDAAGALTEIERTPRLARSPRLRCTSASTALPTAATPRLGASSWLGCWSPERKDSPGPRST